MNSPLELVAQKDGAEIGRWALSPGSFTIGRSPDCLVCLAAEEPDDEHARLIVAHSGSLELEAGGAEVSLDGLPVAGRVSLRPDQYIGVGTVKLMVLSPDVSGDVSLPDEPGTSLPPEFRDSRRYEVGRQIARGGMGAILQARQSTIRRSVAMKVILGRAGEDPQQRLRFIEEAQITGQLEHPNIVPVHDAGLDAEGRVFYTMKLVRGITLKKILDLQKQGEAATVKKYPLPALLTIFQKACDAVAFAHSKGVIHRDLKPENIMIGSYGEVLVMDWGLAKLIRRADPPPGSGGGGREEESVASARLERGDEFCTNPGAIMGTPAYMSPEQALGELDRLDERSDIFSLGIILYELLTLARPFTAKRYEELLAQLTAGQPPVAPAVANQRSGSMVPPSLSAVAMKALAFAPPARYQQVKALQEELTAWQNGFATSAEKAGAWRQITLLIKRHRGSAVTAAASVVIIVALTALYLSRVVASERRAVAGERQALDSLARLEATAPIFAEQARALMEGQRFPQALEKITVAASLKPEVAGYWVQRGHILESLFRFAEAKEAYEQALRVEPGNISARENAELCARLVQEQGPRTDPLVASIAALNEIMRKEGRDAEAVATLLLLKNDKKTIIDTWLARLRKNKIEPISLELGDDGFFKLTVSRDAVKMNLEALKGMPLVYLDLNTNDHPEDVTDLTPLQGLPLRTLTMGRRQVRGVDSLRDLPLEELFLTLDDRTEDLSFVQRMPLKSLRVYAGSVENIEALRGHPLERLCLYGPRFSDLSALRGMPLKDFRAVDCAVTDLSPLAGMNLETIELKNTKVTDLSLLAGQRITDATLGGQGLDDFSVIATWPLTKQLLVFAGFRNKDLELLRGKSIALLDLSGTRVTDLSFLPNLSIGALDVRGLKITDFTPLARVPTLSSVALTMTPEVAVLRNVRTITKFTLPPNRPPMSGADFWEEYDAWLAHQKR